MSTNRLNTLKKKIFTELAFYIYIFLYSFLKIYFYPFSFNLKATFKEEKFLSLTSRCCIVGQLGHMNTRKTLQHAKIFDSLYSYSPLLPQRPNKDSLY